jgi:CobQ-like glutamine amidotransferase family enzyme
LTALAMTTVRPLRIVHLFPDVLRFYGDGGNVGALVSRAAARSIVTEVTQVPVGAARIPPADLVLIGGGQDREQVTVARELERIGEQLTDLVAGGTALLAVCGGYQNLGIRYRTSLGDELACPGLLPVTTDATAGSRRLVGPVLAQVSGDLALQERPRAVVGDATEERDPATDRTVVGFENHGGRTTLEAGARPFASVEIGHGNNDLDATEGVLVLPGEGGLQGLRIGTYLHGPLLPRNPHLADALIAAALAHGGEAEALAPLEDGLAPSHRARGAADPGLGASGGRPRPGAHRLLRPASEAAAWYAAAALTTPVQ